MIVFLFDNNTDTSLPIKKAICDYDEAIRIFCNESVGNALNLCRDEDDIVFFLDTRLHTKKHNSFSLALFFREKLPHCHIVFMSSYQEDMHFCLKNLIRPSGFLLKPLSQSEIITIISSVENTNRRQSRSKTLYISTHEFKRAIDINNVVYFSTSGKKLLCITSTGERIEFYGTIADLEKRFSEDLVRCHQGFLVNKLFIKEIRKGEIELDVLSETIPVSQKYRHSVLERIS